MKSFIKWRVGFFMAMSFAFYESTALAYRVEGGDIFLGAGIGASVNVARYNMPNASTPKSQMPLLLHIDYALDQNIGVFGGVDTFFSSGNLGTAFKVGAKYRLSYLNAPYVPYFSLAFYPSFLFPIKKSPIHFNIGVSPGVGINYFVLAKFLIGLHFCMIPSLAFIGRDKKFEFLTLGYFDVTFRV